MDTREESGGIGSAERIRPAFANAVFSRARAIRKGPRVQRRGTRSVTSQVRKRRGAQIENGVVPRLRVRGDAEHGGSGVRFWADLDAHPVLLENESYKKGPA